MLREKVVPVAWLLSAAVLVGGSVGLAARANATPALDYAVTHAQKVCRTLDKYPSFAGIEGIADAIVKETGFGYYDAGMVIGLSVNNVCPEYIPLIQAYADAVDSTPVLYKETA